MIDFKTYTLSELCIGKGTYGIAAPAIPYDANKYTYLRITDINDDGSIDINKLMSVDDNSAESYLLKKNDIVFARTGNSTGRTYFYEEKHGTLVYAGFLIKFSLDEKKINPRILKYYTHTQEYYNWIKSFDTGGTRGNINAKVYGSMEIKLPNRNVQDKIVEILKSLDDKIEVNRKINENLEQQAQALFKSWFVDFEPFKDGKFVELGGVIKTTSGGTPSRKKLEEYYTSANIKWIKSKELNCSFIIDSEEKINEKAIKESSAKLLPKDSVLIAMYGATVGQYGIINEPMACNQAVCALIPNENYPYTFLYMFAKNNKDVLINKAVGSAQQNISQVLIKQMHVSSEIEKIRNYNKVVFPLFENIRKNTIENEHLSSLRNTLLPKLMSGEIEL